MYQCIMYYLYQALSRTTHERIGSDLCFGLFRCQNLVQRYKKYLEYANFWAWKIQENEKKRKNTCICRKKAVPLQRRFETQMLNPN